MLECLKYIFNEYILAYSFVKLRCGKKDVSIEVIAKLPSNRQNAASEGKERKRSVVTTPSVWAMRSSRRAVKAVGMRVLQLPQQLKALS